MAAEKIKQLKAFDEAARLGLGQAMAADADVIEAEVNAGKCSLWRVGDHSYMVLRIDVYGSGRRVLMVVCYQGEKLVDIVPGLMQAARLSGCEAVRYHTTRHGINRMVKGFGFSEVERVYEAEING